MKPLYWLGLALLLSAVVGGYALREQELPEPVPVTASPPPAVAEVPRAVVQAPVEEAPQPEPEPMVVEEGDGVLRIDLSGNASFFELFEQIGIADYEEKLAKWGMERGYAALDDQGNPILDQPYEQYDNDTLRAFADGGDMWAQQFLADRLKASNPTEALEWYRKAAVNGSVHAMTEMARLHRDLAYSKTASAALANREAGTKGLQNQVKAARSAQRSPPNSPAIEGYAWAAVAERAGWDPMRGGMTAGFVGAKLNDKQKEAACVMANDLFSGLVSERKERGLGEYSSTPPPVVFDPGTVGGTACASSQAPNYQEQCREVQVTVGGQISRLWTCGQ